MIITSELDLRKKCIDSSIFEGMQIISALENELASSDVPGVGLAANQIGIYKKVCIIRTKFSINLINPRIIEKNDLREFENEGCLSFPNKWIVTKRHNEVFVKDLLHPKGIVATGLDAVVIEHEVGHLYGEIMYDYEIERPSLNLKCWCGNGKKYKKCHKGKIIDA